MTKWRTSDPDRPAVWWRHWPEILPRVPTIKTAHRLRLCWVFSYSMKFSVTCDILMVQILYKRSWFRMMFRLLATGHSNNLYYSHYYYKYYYYYYYVWFWTVFFWQLHDIFVDTSFKILKYNRPFNWIPLRFINYIIQQMSHSSPTPFPSLPTLYPIPLTQSAVNTQSP